MIGTVMLADAVPGVISEDSGHRHVVASGVGGIVVRGIRHLATSHGSIPSTETVNTMFDVPTSPSSAVASLIETFEIVIEDRADALSKNVDSWSG